MGFQGRVGTLEAGMKADAILVDLDRALNDPWCTSDSPIAEAFLHRSMGSTSTRSSSGGRVVMEDRRIRTIDVPALYREIRKAARPITPAQRRRAEMLHRLKPHVQAWYNGWLAGDADPFYGLNSRGG